MKNLHGMIKRFATDHLPFILIKEVKILFKKTRVMLHETTFDNNSQRNNVAHKL